MIAIRLTPLVFIDDIRERDTAKGRALFRSLDPVVRRRQDRLLQGFSPEEVDAAFSLIRRLRDNFKA